MKKWTLIEELDVSPSPFFPLYKHTVKTDKEVIIDDYFVGKVKDGALVLILTDDKQIILVEQYKHGAQEIVLELPGGMIDSTTHSAEETARRELLEETGMEVSEMLPLGYIYVCPPKLTSKNYGFIGLHPKITASQNLEETESIHIKSFSFAEVDQLIATGHIISSDTIALISIAKLKYPELFIYEQ